jgi:hypothetical protein
MIDCNRMAMLLFLVSNTWVPSPGGVASQTTYYNIAEHWLIIARDIPVAIVVIMHLERVVHRRVRLGQRAV